MKLSGHICDSCRIGFKPDDTIYELCPECYNTVWVVMNIFRDGTKELSSIHHTKESAEKCVKDGEKLVEQTNITSLNPCIDRQIHQWCVF